MYSGVAQLAERLTVNQDVVGSSPTAGAKEDTMHTYNKCPRCKKELGVYRYGFSPSFCSEYCLSEYNNNRHTPAKEVKEYQVSNGVLKDIHSKLVCAGQYCCIHKPSDHHMKDWPQYWRSDKHMMERICEHGVGHPDPDDPATDRFHGCDGCCGEQNE